MKNISAGIPQDSVLGPIFYSLYTADIPTNTKSITAMFADNTTITRRTTYRFQSITSAIGQNVEKSR